jgi:signal transduction histidine kinase
VGFKPIKILLIEDSLFATRLAKQMLTEAESPLFITELKCADRLSTGLKYLDEDEIDIVLLDLTLPDSHDLETFATAQSKAQEVPIIVMSGLEDEKLAIEAVQRGAQDYLVKGQIDSNLLKRSILYAIERNRAEKELRRYREHLEELVEERTAELKEINEQLKQEIIERRRTEEELKGTVKALERSNKDLEQFAYVASHDLQEPLRMVASYVQLLERRYKDRLDSDAKEFIAFAVDGATRMQKLINDLLSYSRVSTRGKEFKNTDSKYALDQAIDNLRMVVKDSGAVITYDELPKVNADETQLIQLFQNLIDNAIKFRSREVPNIHISAKDNRSEWLFSVADNGIGIDPQYAERIFIIFQRLHEREKYPGTGIGLAICKRIIERHGGRIWVDSEPGKGSTFFFTIPMRGGQ